jgi:HSF-type DNA-binding
MISAGTSTTCIRWLRHGRAFKIFDKQRLVNDVLPHFFQGQNEFGSFQRQLNLYGFLRMTAQGPDQHAYYHEYFLRNRPHLCVLMTRSRIAAHSKRRSYDSTSEPNFHKMPPMDSGAKAPRVPPVIPSMHLNPVGGLTTHAAPQPLALPELLAQIGSAPQLARSYPAPYQDPYQELASAASIPRFSVPTPASFAQVSPSDIVRALSSHEIGRHTSPTTLHLHQKINSFHPLQPWSNRPIQQGGIPLSIGIPNHFLHLPYEVVRTFAHQELGLLPNMASLQDSSHYHPYSNASHLPPALAHPSMRPDRETTHSMISHAVQSFLQMPAANMLSNVGMVSLPTSSNTSGGEARSSGDDRQSESTGSSMVEYLRGVDLDTTSDGSRCNSKSSSRSVSPKVPMNPSATVVGARAKRSDSKTHKCPSSNSSSAGEYLGDIDLDSSTSDSSGNESNDSGRKSSRRVPGADNKVAHEADLPGSSGSERKPSKRRKRDSFKSPISQGDADLDSSRESSSGDDSKASCHDSSAGIGGRMTAKKLR